MTSVLMWIIFNIFVLILLALDLGVFHRKNHVITVKEALLWSVLWFILALMFNLGIYWWFDKGKALEFLTGYLIEKSLSVDNIFVFIMIFSYFKVPPAYQHKVLFWGIFGALIMRGILIALGAALIQNFHWIIYIFGGFLVITGIRMAFQQERTIHPEKNIVVRFFKLIVPVTADYREDSFFIKINGTYYATLLFVVLLIVETTDMIFAVDSIPAIFAITSDSFIVYTSNVFAILGLRSLYFALAGVIDLFHYLKFGLSLVLVFVGFKMILVDFYKIPISIALIVVLGIITISIIASLLHRSK